MTIFDSSGIEASVTENNPKYANRIIRHIAFYNKDFFSKHPLIKLKPFLGDTAFDTVHLYQSLLIGNTFGNGQEFPESIYSTKCKIRS